jgi:hypothetical protein
MRKYKVLLLLLTISITSYGQKAEKIEKGWVKEDSIFITKVINAYKHNPLGVLPLLSFKGNKHSKLGFDYYLVSGGNGKGYVSIWYDFVFYKDKLISFRLTPQMPDDKRLINRYEKIYASLFTIDDKHQVQTIFYGYDEMTKPIGDLVLTSINDKRLQFLMTPYSGVVYGDRGGYSNSVLQNRANYNAIKDQITPAIDEMLLNSKNPATRLLAIEYYYQHPELFVAYKNALDKRIKEIFNEMPTVDTMSGCIGFTDDAEQLVRRFASVKF